MDKKQLQELLPLNKDDSARAIHLAALDNATLKPIVWEMLRWLRTDESPVAAVFIEFFIRHGTASVEEVEKALTSSRQTHLKYVIVTKVLPHWPRDAVAVVKNSLTALVTASGEPETGLMALSTPGKA